MNCAWCGEKVKSSWSHTECAIKDIITHHSDTPVYEIAKATHPNLFIIIEEELKHAR